MIDDQLEMEFESKGQKRKKEKAQNRKVSDLTSSTISPIRRKDSMGKKDKYVDNSVVLFLDVSSSIILGWV